MNVTAIRERAVVRAFRIAPMSLYAAAVGWGSRRTMPRPLRVPLYQLFARLVGARLDEAELPLEQYDTFGAFFARRLRPGARAVDLAAADEVITPCDGAVAARGTATAGRLIQAKGIDYPLSALLGDEAAAEPFTDGEYLTVYLSPRDYHRVHTPVAGELLGYDYIPGCFLPVSLRFSRTIPDLWAINERVVLHLRGPAGRVAVVMVGATGVSNIQITEKSIESRYLRMGGTRCQVRLPEPVSLARGDELAAFLLGSTVVMVFEPGRVKLADVAVGNVLRVGQPVGTIL